MSIEFRCTNCNKLLRVGDDAAGKKAKCPDCGTLLDIPRAAEPDDVVEELPVVEPARPAAAAPDFTSTAAENPFGAPRDLGQTLTGDGQAPPSGAVTAVAVVNYLMGGLNLLCGIVILAAGGAAAEFLMEAMQQDPNFQGDEAAGAIRMMVFVVGIMVLLFSIPLLAAGYGVQQRYQWGRILTLILGGFSAFGAVMNLVSLNPGIVINLAYSILVFVVLLNRKYAAEFR